MFPVIIIFENSRPHFEKEYSSFPVLDHMAFFVHIALDGATEVESFLDLSLHRIPVGRRHAQGKCCLRGQLKRHVNSRTPKTKKNRIGLVKIRVVKTPEDLVALDTQPSKSCQFSGESAGLGSGATTNAGHDGRLMDGTVRRVIQ